MYCTAVHCTHHRGPRRVTRAHADCPDTNQALETRTCGQLTIYYIQWGQTYIQQFYCRWWYWHCTAPTIWTQSQFSLLNCLEKMVSPSATTVLMASVRIIHIFIMVIGHTVGQNCGIHQIFRTLSNHVASQWWSGCCVIVILFMSSRLNQNPETTNLSQQSVWLLDKHNKMGYWRSWQPAWAYLLSIYI